MADAYPYDLDLHQILIERRRAHRNPNVGEVHSTVLREGPQVSKIAILYQIVNPQDRSLHHYALKLESLKRTKRHGWQVQTDRVFTLETAETDEIRRLIDFLDSVLSNQLPDRDGSFVVMRQGSFERISDVAALLNSVDSTQKLEFLRRVLRELSGEGIDQVELIGVLEDEETPILRRIAVATRLLEYRRALGELERRVEANEIELELQSLLEQHPWMFGSEYSELLHRRDWTRDDRQDFMLRRTVDGFLEIVEIKRPFNEPIMRLDESHSSYYPSHELSKALGQAVRYIEEVDRDRDSILAKDQEESLKIRARVIIGRDGDEAEQRALRSFNAHLHRIEVLTFDQLVRIAQRVVGVFEEEVGRAGIPATDLDGVNDLPF